MEYPLNELVDRLTIHRLKHERTAEPQDEALAAFETALEESLERLHWTVGASDLQRHVDALYEVNGAIWDAEGSLRRGEEEGMGDAEVARRCLEVRDLNRLRNRLKNDIVDEFGSGFLDVKENYAGDADRALARIRAARYRLPATTSKTVVTSAA